MSAPNGGRRVGAYVGGSIDSTSVSLSVSISAGLTAGIGVGISVLCVQVTGEHRLLGARASVRVQVFLGVVSRSGIGVGVIVVLSVRDHSAGARYHVVEAKVCAARWAFSLPRRIEFLLEINNASFILRLWWRAGVWWGPMWVKQE